MCVIQRFLLTLWLVIPMAIGCEPRHHAAPPNPNCQGEAKAELVMKTYEMPAGYGAKLRPILSKVLKQGKDKEPVGRAALTPDGRIVLVAPAGIQAGVQALLDDVKRAKKPFVPPPTIAMTYWILVGRSGPDPNEQQCGKFGQRCLEGGDNELWKVLDPIVNKYSSLGGIHFKLFEKLRLRSLDSEMAKAKGHTARVFQTASASGGKVMADVNIYLHRHAENTVNTRLQFAPEQTIILGQTGFKEDWKKGPLDSQAEKESEGGLLLFVVRGSIEK